MGCTDCSRSGGCGTRKGKEKELLAELLGAIYPSRRWGEPDDAARFRRGVPEAEGRRFARRASAALKAPTWFRPADEAEGESCDWVYILCVGRAPGLFSLRNASVADTPDGDSVRERYLRVALSQMGRIAAVQEISFELDRVDRDGAGDGLVLHEKPRDGVYDPILLKRTQRLIELIVASDMDYLDFGLLTKPASRYLEDLDAGDYADRYGQPAATVNYLFYPQPATAVSTTFLSRHAA
jgi:hypothetical protein